MRISSNHAYILAILKKEKKNEATLPVSLMRISSNHANILAKKKKNEASLCDSF